MKITRDKSPQGQVLRYVCAVCGLCTVHQLLLIVVFLGAAGKLVSFLVTSFGVCMKRAYPYVVSTGRKRDLVQKRKEEHEERAAGAAAGLP